MKRFWPGFTKAERSGLFDGTHSGEEIEAMRLADLRAHEAGRKAENITPSQACWISQRETGIAPQSRRDRPGFVYVIHCEGSDCYKIGIARNAKERLSQLQIGCPYRLILVGDYRVSNMAETEQSLHLALSQAAIRGEWFTLDTEALSRVLAVLSEHDRHYVSSTALLSALTKKGA